MPEEIFIIITLAIIAGSVSGVLKQIFDYLKNRAASQSSGASLTSSELERLLQRTVEKAVAPLVDRMEAIESRLDQATDPQLPAAHVQSRIDPSLLDEADLIEQGSQDALVSRREKGR
jgi:hypothetical protein